MKAYTSILAALALTSRWRCRHPGHRCGKDVYTKTCSICHATGIAGAPRFGNAGDWTPRLAGGVAASSMPAR